MILPAIAHRGENGRYGWRGWHRWGWCAGMAGERAALNRVVRTHVRYGAVVTGPLVILAGQLPGMVDLGQVDRDTAVLALVDQAGWNVGRLRRALVELQQDPDTTPPTLALLHRAAEQAAAARTAPKEAG